jgi:hypothetical protein
MLAIEQGIDKGWANSAFNYTIDLQNKRIVTSSSLNWMDIPYLPVDKQWRPGEILTGATCINHSCGVLHGSYKKSLLCGVPQELFFYFLRARSTTPLKFFYGHFRALARSCPFPDLHWISLAVRCIQCKSHTQLWTWKFMPLTKFADILYNPSVSLWYHPCFIIFLSSSAQMNLWAMRYFIGKH